ncbi:MAG: superoxide dismutase [Rikenellaceae bacterium]
MSTLIHEKAPLSYELGDFKPLISEQTMDYHYNKHYGAYIDNTNKLSLDTEFENMSLVDIVKKSEGTLFNNAAQALNHKLYFDMLTPKQKVLEPKGALLEAIEMSFGSFGAMKEQFSDAAIKHFGSGWVFLVISGKELEIVPTYNAWTPVREGREPILVIDVWEHAYYLDHQNRRADFVKNFWQTLDWGKIQELYETIVSL